MILKNNATIGMFPFLFVAFLLTIVFVIDFVKNLRILLRGEKVTIRIVKTIPCSKGANGRRVLTIIAFEYKGETIERELTLKRKYIEGYNYKSIYVPKGIFKEEIIFGEKTASIIDDILVLDFAFLIFGIFIVEYNEYPNKYNFIVMGIFLFILLGGILIKKIKKKAG
jgi:hypothetical protein